MSSPLIFSAPGKVILHGEHAVVYGKAALAASLDLRCYLILQPCSTGSVILDVPDLSLKKTWGVADILQHLQTETAESTDKEASKLVLLKQLAGISNSDETPSTGSVATLVFIYLLTSIYGDKLGDIPGLHITVLSVLPAGAGLGSSAAYSICLAAAFLTDRGTICSKSNKEPSSTGESPVTKDLKNGSAVSLPKVVLQRLKEMKVDVKSPPTDGCWNREDIEMINEWGLEAEKLIHGTPSGIDNSISAFGGAIRFLSGNITHLQSVPSVKILLVNTNVTRSTKKMVSGVRERHDKHPEVIDPILDSIEAIVDSAQGYFESLCHSHQLSCEEELDTCQQIQELFTINQHLLNALGVGHVSLDKVCHIARQFGLSAKLTGGGGGGCAIALLPPGFSEFKLVELKTSLSEAGFDCWTTNIGSKGVSQHCLT